MGKKSKSNRNLLIGIIAACIILVGAIGASLYFQSALNPYTPPATVTPTEYNFVALDYVTGEERDEAHFAVYRASITGLTASELEDLEYADYTLADTVHSGDDYEPDLEEYDYWVFLTETGMVNMSFKPVLGVNTMYPINMTEDVSMLANSVPAFTTTVNDTSYDTWDITTQTLDLAEGVTAEATSLEGWQSYYDFATDDNYNFVIKVVLNTTASAGDIKLTSGQSYTETVSGANVYIEIPCTLLGENQFQIKFDSDLNDDYHVHSIAVGYGNAASFTQWDIQN